MRDRLVELLKRFELRAKVFQAGPLCGPGRYDSAQGVGHIHVQRSGTLRVESPGRRAIVVDEPSLYFFVNPTSHKLLPQGGEVEMVCATMEFGAGMWNPIARALPGMVLIRLADMPVIDLTLEALFREAEEQHCGRQAVLDRLMEVLFIQVIRDLMDQKRLEVGLLAGLSDPKLARAINALHADPAHAWSLQELATIAGMSRARFAARFRDIVGLTPGAYLTEWRLSDRVAPGCRPVTPPSGQTGAAGVGPGWVCQRQRVVPGFSCSGRCFSY